MSRPLELLALEPEKNRLILQLNNNSNLKELKKRLIFCSKNPIKNQNLIVPPAAVIKKKKKRIVEKKKNNSFFSDYIPSFCFDDFFIILISTLPSPSSFSLELYFKYFNLPIPLVFDLIRNRIKTTPI